MQLDHRLQRARKRLCLPLDVDSMDKALDLVKRMSPYVGLFKIGLEFITTGKAPELIQNIRNAGAEVFYDGKFNDISATVGAAIKQAARLDVKIINLHASSNMRALQAAVANKGNSKIFVVSVLTSFDDNDSDIIYGSPTKAKVLQMARDAKLAGCDGIICSPLELQMLNDCPELDSLQKMTPGIRPAYSQLNDQKRVMTPADAIKAGADYLVIGRPITQPDGMTCEEAVMKILEEIAEGVEVVETEKEAVRQNRIKEIFAQTNAIITDNHFVYASGLHGANYVNKDAVYPHTEAISELALYIAEHFVDFAIDAVLGPANGGIIIAQWVAHHLSILKGRKVFALYADKKEEDGQADFVIKRGQDAFVKDRNILVVEDVLTTGGSVKKVVDAIRAIGGNIVAVSALCNRGDVAVDKISNVPELYCLMNVSFVTHSEDNCPLCEHSVPVNTKLGKGSEFLKKKETVQ